MEELLISLIEISAGTVMRKDTRHVSRSLSMTSLISNVENFQVNYLFNEKPFSFSSIVTIQSVERQVARCDW